VEQVLAPDPPTSSCLCIVYTNGELAAVRLGLRLNPLPLFILELAGVSSLLHVMDALEIYPDNLAFVSLHGLDEGKAFCKGLVLKPDESCSRESVSSFSVGARRWAGGRAAIAASSCARS